jgi:hypothetical protein
MPTMPAIPLDDVLTALASIEQPKRRGEPPVLSPRNVKRRLHLHNGEAQLLLAHLEELGLISGLRADGRTRLMHKETWLSHREPAGESHAA